MACGNPAGNKVQRIRASLLGVTPIIALFESSSFETIRPLADQRLISLESAAAPIFDREADQHFSKIGPCSCWILNRHPPLAEVLLSGPALTILRTRCL